MNHWKKCSRFLESFFKSSKDLSHGKQLPVLPQLELLEVRRQQEEEERKRRPPSPEPSTKVSEEAESQQW